MQGAVGKAIELIENSQRPHECFGIEFPFLFQPRLSTQFRKWKTTFNGLFDKPCIDFSVFYGAQQIASFTPRQAEKQIERCLTEAPHVRRIGVYGTGGIGKTTLLKKIYNTHKEVSDIFDAAISVTVAQFSILELQGAIASQVNLELTDTDIDVPKMKLFAYLKDTNLYVEVRKMKISAYLKELGMEFNNERVDELIFSTRDRNPIDEMMAEECMEIQAMSTDEGWDLFSQVAFKEEGGQIPEQIEHIARKVSSQCKGLHLAINVIASSMIGSNDANEWKRALTQKQSLDFISLITHHPRINRDLFQRSRWSYDCLPDPHLKNHFLYCAMFPQDTTFQVNPLVQMWIAEGLVNTKDTGLSYVKFLENRCLFQVETGDIHWRN